MFCFTASFVLHAWNLCDEMLANYYEISSEFYFNVVIYHAHRKHTQTLKLYCFHNFLMRFMFGSLNYVRACFISNMLSNKIITMLCVSFPAKHFVYCIFCAWFFPSIWIYAWISITFSCKFNFIRGHLSKNQLLLVWFINCLFIFFCLSTFFMMKLLLHVVTNHATRKGQNT